MIEVTYEEFLEFQELASILSTGEFVLFMLAGFSFVVSYCIYGLFEFFMLRKQRKLVEKYIHSMEKKLLLQVDELNSAVDERLNLYDGRKEKR